MDTKRGGRRIIADINITPFTDVVLVLLIIFMVATPILYQNSLKVNLPTTKTRETDEKPKRIDLKISAKGEIRLESKTYMVNNEADWEKLSRHLSTFGGGESTLTIHGDKDCRYEVIMRAIDLSKQSDIKRVMLASQPDR